MAKFKKIPRDFLNGKIVYSFIEWFSPNALEHCIIAKHNKLILDKMVIKLQQIQFDLCKNKLVSFFPPNSLFEKCTVYSHL